MGSRDRELVNGGNSAQREEKQLELKSLDGQECEIGPEFFLALFCNDMFIEYYFTSSNQSNWIFLINTRNMIHDNEKIHPMLIPT